jgi:hypothetical protein
MSLYTHRYYCIQDREASHKNKTVNKQKKKKNTIDYDARVDRIKSVSYRMQCKVGGADITEGIGMGG